MCELAKRNETNMKLTKEVDTNEIKRRQLAKKNKTKTI